MKYAHGNLLCIFAILLALLLISSCSLRENMEYNFEEVDIEYENIRLQSSLRGTWHQWDEEIDRKLTTRESPYALRVAFYSDEQNSISIDMIEIQRDGITIFEKSELEVRKYSPNPVTERDYLYVAIVRGLVVEHKKHTVIMRFSTADREYSVEYDFVPKLEHYRSSDIWSALMSV